MITVAEARANAENKFTKGRNKKLKDMCDTVLDKLFSLIRKDSKDGLFCTSCTHLLMYKEREDLYVAMKYLRDIIEGQGFYFSYTKEVPNVPKDSIKITFYVYW